MKQKIGIGEEKKCIGTEDGVRCEIDSGGYFLCPVCGERFSWVEQKVGDDHINYPAAIVHMKPSRGRKCNLETKIMTEITSGDIIKAVV